MKTEQVNLRLEADIVAKVEAIASAESLDRATTIRRLLQDSINRWQLDRALRGYERGEISIGRAAEEAGITQWELLAILNRQGMSYPMRTEEVVGRLDAWEAKTASPATFARGRQATEEWMGEPVVTLADVPPRPGGVLIVGINPAPRSVESGHYYQGALGKRLWARLVRLGLLENSVFGAEDDAFAEAGNGLTDLVKRPTASAGDISGTELAAGADLLREKVHSWNPGLIVFPFKRAAVAALGTRDLRPGPGPEFEGVVTFLLSGPYAPASEATRSDEELQSVLQDVRVGGPRADRPSRKIARASGKSEDARDHIVAAANVRFGDDAVRSYLQSERQSDAARALGISGVTLRNITRSLGVYVSRGGEWDQGTKLAVLAEIVRRHPGATASPGA
jgi:TDG/mug DNA glycosylase family protein